MSALTAAINGFNTAGITSAEIINRMATVDAAFAVSSKDLADGLARAGATVQLGIRNPLSMERYRRYLELGVVNTNTRMGDLRNLMRDVRFGDGNIATDSVLRPMLNS